MIAIDRIRKGFARAIAFAAARAVGTPEGVTGFASGRPPPFRTLLRLPRPARWSPRGRRREDGKPR